MSWTVTGGATTRYWAIAAVPINPAPVGPTYDLTMIADPSGGGTTEPGAGANTYPEGTIVDISATHAPGYRFDHWDGDVANADAAYTTVTMDADKTVTAHFVATTTSSPWPSRAAAAAPPRPTVPTPTTPSGRAHLGDAQHRLPFDHWIGDVADANAASTTVTMDADKTVTAYFVATHELTMEVAGSGGSTTPAVGLHTYTANDGRHLGHGRSRLPLRPWEGDVANADAAAPP